HSRQVAGNNRPCWRCAAADRGNDPAAHSLKQASSVSPLATAGAANSDRSRLFPLCSDNCRGMIREVSDARLKHRFAARYIGALTVEPWFGCPRPSRKPPARGRQAWLRPLASGLAGFFWAAAPFGSGARVGGGHKSGQRLALPATAEDIGSGGSVQRMRKAFWVHRLLPGLLGAGALGISALSSVQALEEQAGEKKALDACDR